MLVQEIGSIPAHVRTDEISEFRREPIPRTLEPMLPLIGPNIGNQEFGASVDFALNAHGIHTRNLPGSAVWHIEIFQEQRSAIVGEMLAYNFPRRQSERKDIPHRILA